MAKRVNRFRKAPGKCSNFEVILNVSSLCPHKCIYCYGQYFNKITKATMKEEIFYQIIDILKKEGVKKIYPYMSGDCLTHPKIYSLLDYAIEKRINIQISTKLGIKIDFDKLKPILEKACNYKTGFNFTIEIDASNKELFNEIAQGDFELIKSNLKELKDLFYSNRTNFRINIQTIIIRLNENDIKNIPIMLKDIGYNLSSLKFTNKLVGYYYCKEPEVTKDILSKVIPKSKSRINFSRGKVVFNKNCPNDFSLVTINPNGDVLPCCHDMFWKYPIANVIKEGSLLKILKSAKYINTVKAGKARRLSICKGCN